MKTTFETNYKRFFVFFFHKILYNLKRKIYVNNKSYTVNIVEILFGHLYNYDVDCNNIANLSLFQMKDNYDIN